MAVVLTEADLSAVERQKRMEQVEKNRAIVKSRDKQVILDGIEIPIENGEYPIEDVILYSSKVEPENRMLGHHYECIITFRGVEFYSMEQLFSSLKFNERPYILEDIMTAPDGVTAKKRSHVYMKQYLYDSDFNFKSARLNAMCFLFKYLSVPEYRNRLRELRGRTLFENKGEYEGGNKMDKAKKKLIGRNTDGKAMMAVRDMMLKYEDEAIAVAEADKGSALTEKEREDVLQGVLDAVRQKFENDETVKADSDNVIKYIYEHTDTIPLKRYWPKPGAKAILVEFDNCVFDTSADDNVRKAKGERDWSRGYENLSWEEYQAGECINDYYYPGYGQVVIYHLKQEFSHHRTDEAVTGNSSVSIGYKTTTDMKRTFDINLVDGHLLISDNGNTILVDTGSPLTVHQEDTLCFLGREFPVHTSIMGDGIGSLCRLSGIEFTTLLGMDILSQYRVVFDYENRQITFLTDEESGLEGTTLPLVNVMGGVKAVTMQINGQQLKVAIDTGAPLSYVDTMVTDGLEPVGEKEDFHPMAGRYTTPVFQLEAVLGGKRFTGSYGNLPAMMGMSLQLMGLDGVVGYDFFRSFKVLFDFRNSSLVVA